MWPRVRCVGSQKQANIDVPVVDRLLTEVWSTLTSKSWWNVVGPSGIISLQFEGRVIWPVLLGAAALLEMSSPLLQVFVASGRLLISYRPCNVDKFTTALKISEKIRPMIVLKRKSRTCNHELLFSLLRPGKGRWWHLIVWRLSEEGRRKKLLDELHWILFTQSWAVYLSRKNTWLDLRSK